MAGQSRLFALALANLERRRKPIAVRPTPPGHTDGGLGPPIRTLPLTPATPRPRFKTLPARPGQRGTVRPL